MMDECGAYSHKNNQTHIRTITHTKEPSPTHKTHHSLIRGIRLITHIKTIRIAQNHHSHRRTIGLTHENHQIHILKLGYAHLNWGPVWSGALPSSSKGVGGVTVSQE